jgi:predicted nucleic acid-binding protein
VRARRSRTIALSAEPRLVYADSSALVKLVIEEPESAALERYLARAPVLATSRVALVEVPRATSLANPAPEVQGETQLLLASCMLIDVTDGLLRAAAGLASATVRTLDAIHLASALRIEADELVAYDHRLLAAAAEHAIAVASPGALSVPGRREGSAP